MLVWCLFSISFGDYFLWSCCPFLLLKYLKYLSRETEKKTFSCRPPPPPPPALVYRESYELGCCNSTILQLRNTLISVVHHSFLKKKSSSQKAAVTLQHHFNIFVFVWSPQNGSNTFQKAAYLCTHHFSLLDYYQTTVWRILITTPVWLCLHIRQPAEKLFKAFGAV